MGTGALTSRTRADSDWGAQSTEAQRNSEKSSAQVQEHRRLNRSAKKPFNNYIRSRDNQQKSMNKNEVGSWDGVMVELHKINIDHDARGVDMMHAGIDGAGVREMDMHFE